MGRSVLVLAFLGGCSAFMTRPPHDPRPGQWIVCSDSYTPPMVDSAAAAIGVGGGLASWFIVDDRRDNSGVQMTDGGFDFTELFVKTAAVIAILGGLSYGFSAAVGYSTAGNCRKLKDAHPRGYQPPMSTPAPTGP